MKNVLLFLVVISLNSCVSISKGGFHPPFDGYQPNNFQYLAPISGHSTESYFLGIGGDYKGGGLYGKALVNLKSNHQLNRNQTLVNITYDEKISWFIIPIWVEKKVTVTADVIEFYSAGFTDETISKNQYPNEPEEIINSTIEVDITNLKSEEIINSTNEVGIINLEPKEIINSIIEVDITNFKTTVKKGHRIKLVTKFEELEAYFISHGVDQFSISKDGSEWYYFYADVISISILPTIQK